MPIYDYLCTTCGPFEERRPMSESKVAVPCGICRVPAERLPGAPRLNLMASNNRIAETRNEKSAHEPDVMTVIGRDGARRENNHGGHSHAHDHRRSQAPSSHKHAPNRPWMLGH